MVKATFEHEGDFGLLTVITHFGKTVMIQCQKRTEEQFRLGGTAINQVVSYEGLILDLPKNPSLVSFRAFYTSKDYFEGQGILSSEEWDVANLHCYVTEYYDLDMEGKRPGWFISKAPIKDAHHLFINLDVLDGVGNIIKRCRVSPLTGEYKWLTF